MKLIIDISEEQYNDIVKYLTDNDGNYAYSDFNLREIIRNGTPYNPSGDCISRKDLKLAIREMPDWCGDDAYYSGVNDVSRLIDNAQAVPQVTVFAETADEKAVADLKAELENVIESRPQGKWVLEEEECPICGKLRIR